MGRPGKAVGVSENLKDWLSQRRLLPKEGSFAICRLKPKEASLLWWSLLWFCPYAKRAYNEYLDLCRGASNSKAVRNGKVNLSDVKINIMPLNRSQCMFVRRVIPARA